jgi:hypothetical protein
MASPPVYPSPRPGEADLPLPIPARPAAQRPDAPPSLAPRPRLPRTRAVHPPALELCRARQRRCDDRLQLGEGERDDRHPWWLIAEEGRERQVARRTASDHRRQSTAPAGLTFAGTGRMVRAASVARSLFYTGVAPEVHPVAGVGTAAAGCTSHRSGEGTGAALRLGLGLAWSWENARPTNTPSQRASAGLARAGYACGGGARLRQPADAAEPMRWDGAPWRLTTRHALWRRPCLPGLSLTGAASRPAHVRAVSGEDGPPSHLAAPV